MKSELSFPGRQLSPQSAARSLVLVTLMHTGFLKNAGSGFGPITRWPDDPIIRSRCSLPDRPSSVVAAEASVGDGPEVARSALRALGVAAGENSSASSARAHARHI